jgi:hypothetical protein
MARRGGAAAAEDTGGGSALSSEVESLGPSENTFSDPLRAERPEPDEPPPPPSPPPSPTPDEPGGGGETVGAGAPAFDARSEIERLRSELTVSHQRQALFERELQFRALAAAQQAAAQPQPQQQIDPTLQEVIDILQVSDEDLVEVFQGGPKAAMIVTRALQATALIAIQAAEKRLVAYYNRDQGARQQAQVIDQRAGQMHQAFWSNYPELADHEIIVQYFAAQVAAEQAQAPRFDWQSAQQEVAARTVQYLRQSYNVNITPATGSYAAPRATPTLQSRLRPAFGEMGGGQARNGGPTAQTALTAEILDLGR